MKDNLRAEYYCWQGMRRRCNTRTNPRYPHYGGRGIRVCARWDSFALFLKDMGPRPSMKHSIDRIDGDGNYEPKNCRWATNSEQCRNRRNNVLAVVNGELLCLSAIAEKYGFHKTTIRSRYLAGWRGQALIEPAWALATNQRRAQLMESCHE